jgi:hypothetical protein
MGRTMTRAAALAATALLVVGVAACGDDDEDDATDTTDATDEATDDTAGADGAPAAFCDGLVEFNTAVFQVDISEDTPEEEVVAVGEELAPLFDDIASNAPDELAGTADELNEAIQALEEGDAEAFNSDATFTAYTDLVADAIEACGFEAVDVVGVDYAYEGVEDSYAAGTVAFRFANESESEEHEVAILRKADGVDLSWDELLALPEEEAMTQTEFKGAAFAPPGGQGGTLTELTAGDYLMICFIPVGGAEDGPPHFTQGMMHEFTVE